MEEIEAIPEFVRAVACHLEAIVIGGVVGVTLDIFERRRGKSISWGHYVFLIALALFPAVYLAWFAERDLANRNISDLSDARNKIKELSSTSQTQKIVDLESQITEVSQRLGPDYPFTKDQYDALKKSLSLSAKTSSTPVAVYYEGSSKEYANRLVKLLSGANWEAGLQGPLILSPSEFGIEIDLPEDVLSGKKNPNRDAKFLMDALTEAKISYNKYPLDINNGADYEIVVAAPP